MCIRDSHYVWDVTLGFVYATTAFLFVRAAFAARARRAAAAPAAAPSSGPPATPEPG